jgi:hypothetical protein
MADEEVDWDAEEETVDPWRTGSTKNVGLDEDEDVISLDGAQDEEGGFRRLRARIGSCVSLPLYPS